LCRITVALCPQWSPVPLVYAAASLNTPLRGALLTAPHRQSNDQNHKHDRNRDRDHNDAGADREHEKDGAHTTPSALTLAPA
jgi:hypothetical protein